MSYLEMESVKQRLRNGISPLSTGEIKTLLNHLMEEVDELKGQLEGLRRSQSTGTPEKKDPSSGVRRGRKPKHNSGETSQTSGDA